MTTDNRMTWGLITDVLDLLERHGYRKYDTQHTGEAVGVIYDLTRVYEGRRDAPYGTYLDQATPSPPAAPSRPGRHADPDAVVPTGTDISTVLSALHMAADDKRNSAGMCADCGDRSCFACQLCLRDARTYDQMARQVLQDEQTTRNARGQPGPSGSPAPPSQPLPAREREAGQ